MKNWLILAVLGSVFIQICAMALEYPGPAPGQIKTVINGPALSISNKVISTEWTLPGQGLRPRRLANPQTGDSLSLTGEVFQVVLADGQRYPASTMRVGGQPVLRHLVPRADAAKLADRLAGQQVEVPFRSEDGRLAITWRAVAYDDGNYIRQEIDVAPLRDDVTIREIIWMNQMISGARMAGRVDGSPIVAQDFFLGYEDPMAMNTVAEPAGPVVCHLQRDALLRQGDKLTQSFVLGVAPAGQMRRGFLYYLERERAHPYRPFLHYNSWYDVSWPGFAMNETNCLEAIHSFGKNFIQAHGVVMDALVFDDGWDDPQSLWQFHAGFPRGFAPHAELCRQYQTRLGVWLSPFGGYAEAKAQRLKFGAAQGYETNAMGFSLAGPKYYAAFKTACVNMIRKYGANHFKFDGIASGMMANGSGTGYILDTEAMRRLMLELRREDPNIFINLTTGSWPSPFWLRYADSVWRQGGDMGFAGKGGKQQQWLNYRDQEVHQNIVGKGPLYPLNSLMTQGVAYSRHGDAAQPDYNSAGFKDDVRAFFGGGTGLQELYIQPQRLTAGDWRVLAEAARWSRANAGVLVDTHWIGGNPAKFEVYGYASWTSRKGIVMLRNPDDQTHAFGLDVQTAFELPPGAARKFTLKSPWAEDASKPALPVQAGQPIQITLKPFEVFIWEAHPSAP